MKKVMKAAFVVAIAAVAGYNIYTNLKSNTVSDLVLANVEALADSEWGEGFNCQWTDSNYWFCTPLGDGLGCVLALCKFVGV